ncbi:MAG: hypothetical protein U9R25_17985 [Chloroflexota bacterium]|nr:hypothetical protein [Chloroflexota bacterium]
MVSLLEKVNALIKANLHLLVVQALQSSSMGVINQYMREVEDHLDDLQDASNTVGEQVKTVRRKRETYQVRSERLDRDIDLFLLEGQEALAIGGQGKLNATNRVMDAYGQQLLVFSQEHGELKDAHLKLQAKLTAIRQEKEELQGLLDLAEAKDVGLATISSLDDLAGTGDHDVDRIVENIRNRLDRVSAQDIDRQMRDILERDEIEAQLLARKRRLGIVNGVAA